MKKILTITLSLAALISLASCNKAEENSNAELVGTTWEYAKGDTFNTTYTTKFKENSVWEEVAANDITSTTSKGTYKYVKPTITINGTDGQGRQLETIVATVAQDGKSFTTNEGWTYYKK